LTPATPSSSLKKASFLTRQAPFSAPAKSRHLLKPSEKLFDEEFSGSFTLKENDSDGENVDPEKQESQSGKRSKGLDGTPSKLYSTPKFVFTEVVRQPEFFTPTLTSSGGLKRKVSGGNGGKESISLEGTKPNVTPTSLRGTLKPRLRRASLLSGKRSSLTPFRRINPPTTPGSAVPFSIDAALSGTISTYTPSNLSSNTVPVEERRLSHHKMGKEEGQKALKTSWFFEIYEDTADEHASNMLQHSASVLDISSDDDVFAAKAKAALKKGKENVPPVVDDVVVGQEEVHTGRNTGARSGMHRGIHSARRAEHLVKMREEGAMVEDRMALGDLDVRAFWAEGIEEGAEVVVVEDEDDTVENGLRGVGSEIRTGVAIYEDAVDSAVHT
jgi:hypothetical protein